MYLACLGGESTPTLRPSYAPIRIHFLRAGSRQMLLALSGLCARVVTTP